MRTLNLNKTKLWYVNPKAEETIEVEDEDGYPTGETVKVYGLPKEISLHLYPATGDIIEREFGVGIDVDMVSTSTIELEKGTTLYHIKPTDDYNTDYDYKVTNILKSLNSYQYGLKGRR